MVENVKTQMETFKEVSEPYDKCEKCDKEQWEKDFEEIRHKLTEQEEIEVQNTLPSFESRIYFISKYLTYRKLDYIGNTYEEISHLKQSFYNKLSRTQKFITNLKRENEEQIIQYETDMQCLHSQYQKLEEDYEILQNEHNNCINWEDHYELLQQEYAGNIRELSHICNNMYNDNIKLQEDLKTK